MAEMIFVDTWAWAAMSDRRDQWHAAAQDAYRQLRTDGARFVTTNVVVYETCSLVRSRCSHEAAVALMDGIRTMAATPAVLRLVWVEPDIDEAAFDILRRYDDKEFSFVDCISFAVVRDLRLTTAFTGDDHFRQMGFRTVPTDQ